MQQPLGVPEFKPVPVIRVMEGGGEDAMNGDERRRSQALLKRSHYGRMYAHHDHLACWHDQETARHEERRDHFGALLREMNKANEGE